MTTFPARPLRVPFTAWCPACRVDHEWVQVRATPAKEPQPVCPEGRADE